MTSFSPHLLAGWKVTSGPDRLVGGEHQSCMLPVWSPDGNKIAFTGPGYAGIWVLEVQNGQIKQISNETAVGFGFAWSGSGAAIVSRVTRYEGARRFNAVKVFNVNTGQAWPLTEYQLGLRGLPNWTENDRRIYIFDGQKLNVFDSGIETPDLQKTATGKPLHYIENGQIAVKQTGSDKASTFDPLGGRRYINLVASPDGGKLAFEVVGGDMYVMNVDGTGLIDLGTGNRPQWSPDGQYLVYQITEDNGHDFTRSDIYTISIAGTDKAQLTNTNARLEMNASWSPDGNRIVFDTFEEGAIYIVNVEKE